MSYKLQIATEEYCKKHYVNYREFIKYNNKIVAFITKLNNGGYSVCIGKPSDNEVACFTGNNTPFTLEVARNRAFEYLGGITLRRV